jgi:hypothetical protein
LPARLSRPRVCRARTPATAAKIGNRLVGSDCPCWQTRTSSLGAARPLLPSADIGPGGQSVGQAAQSCLADTHACLRKLWPHFLTTFATGAVRHRAPHVAGDRHQGAVEITLGRSAASSLTQRGSKNRAAPGHRLSDEWRPQAVGVLGAGDPPRMMEQFFALLWGDLLVSRLLGAASIPTRADIEPERPKRPPGFSSFIAVA